MKIIEWLPTVVGKKIDYDGAFGNQCVDLARAWWKTIGAMQLPPVQGAVDFWTKFNPGISSSWKQIGREDMVDGDAVIFDSTSTNVYGHIALFIFRDGGDIITLDQNWPGGKLEPVGVFRHPLNGRVLGGLRWVG